MIGKSTRTEAYESIRIEVARRGANRFGGVFEPMDLIRFALDRHGEKLCVVWSGGRCSTIVLHMALKLKPDIKVLFCDTGVEYPETYEFVKRISQEWNLNLLRAKPRITFWECVERWGFPKIRKSAVKGSPGTPKCCLWLKEEPTRRVFKEHGLEAELTGLRVVESRPRMWGIYDRGQYYYAKKYGMWRYHPIAFWPEWKIQSYIDENEVPMSKLYEIIGIRSGCWPCTSFRAWKEQLAYTKPKFYEFLMRKMGERGMAKLFQRTRVEIPCGGRVG